VALQPPVFVAVTVYVPEVVTPIEEVIAPVLHRYDVPPLAVSVVVVPVQAVCVPAGEIVGIGI